MTDLDRIVLEIRERRDALRIEVRQLDKALRLLVPQARKRSPRITEEQIRDAVVAFVGPFRAAHVADALGVHPSSKTIRRVLSDFAARGILTVTTSGRTREYAYSKPQGAHLHLVREPRQRRVGSDRAVALPADVRTSSKDVNRLLRRAAKQGLKVERTKAHVRVVGARGSVVVASSASDHRAFENTRAELRRIGMRI